ncbi:ATP-binding protein [Streptomyces sp. NPDC046261]|uniref:ATP-binding protein n=1 Tax=Streptomyces sp. NPDC046261 TaxID=3157200 RepID=UPI0033EBAF98
MSGANGLVSRCNVETRRVRRWKHHPKAVGLARSELRAALVDWGLTQIEDQALIVLSELVTNAVKHAHTSPGREIETSFCRGTCGVRIAVDDADETPPRIRTGGATSGRGLILVAEMADRWGVRPRRGIGKSVWAVVTIPGSEGWL